MKLKLNQLKPNPFKKNINGGKLDEDTIKKIKSNIKELGLMGSLPVFKKDNQYFLIAGHHRVEALKRTFGKEHEISVDIKDYSEDQILRGMVIENLTQQDNEHKEERANIVTIRDYLNKHKDVLEGLRSARQPSKFSNINSFDKACASDISFWIDKGNGDVISHDKVTNLININDNLSPDLLGLVEKKKTKNKDEKSITVMEAVELSKIPDKKEQKEVLKAIKEVDEGRPYQLVSKYRSASDEVKEKVRSGEISLSEVDIESFKQKNKEAYDEATKSKDEGLKIIRTAEILQNVREEISKTTKELDRFFYKVKAVRFARLSWGSKREQKDFKVFVGHALNKANLWVKTLEKIKEEVEYEN